MSEIQKLDPSCIDCKLLWDTLNEKYEIKEQLKCTLELTSLGLLEWSLKDNIVILSDEVYKIIGFSKEDFDGTMDFIIEEIIHDDSKKDFRASILKASLEGIIPNEVYRINHCDKSICWIQLYSKLIYDDSGNPQKIIGTLTDVSDKINKDSSIIKSITFLETLIEILPNPIFYKDSDGIYKYCNSSFADLIGKPKNQIIGWTVDEITCDKLANISNSADLELMNSKGVQEYEAPIEYSDGTTRDIIFRKSAHVNEENKVLGLVGIMEDITDKKIIEKELNMFHKIKDTFISINRNILIYESEKDFFDGIQDKLQSIFENCDQSSVLEVTETNKLLMLTNRGYNLNDVDNFSLNLTDSFIWDYTNGDLRDVSIINDIEKYFNSGFKAAPKTSSGQAIKSALMLPLYFENKLKWILSFDSIDNNIYTKTDILIAKYICEELPILYRVFNLYQESKRLSRYDALTGFMNFDSFKLALSETFEVSYNYNEEFSIALFELSEYSKIIDSFGHDKGDNYLLTFSKILKSHFTESDMLYKIGVNKFAILFFDDASKKLIDEIESIFLEFELLNSNNGLEHINHNLKYDISTYSNTENDELLTLDNIKLIIV